MRFLSAASIALAAVLVLSACGGSGSSATPSPAETEPPADGFDVTAEAIFEWASNTEWSFAPQGIDEPITVAMEGAAATDDLMRTYQLGAGIDGDVNGDGVVDMALPIVQQDGNAVQELWYIWLGRADADDGTAVADQVVYPVARTSRCGDVVNAVTAIDGGFRIDQTLWMPHEDSGRDCASGGTGEQTRDITVTVIDGEPYPIQTAPVSAWGGVCPRSEWLDGIIDTGIEARAAMAPSAPDVVTAEETVALYELPDAPLLTASGVRFFGFQPDSQTGTDAGPVRMHCAFAG